MMDYTELVKALRLCQFGECGCGKCYYKELKGDWCTEDNHPEFFDCDDKLKLDAAAAIEALEAEVKRLNMRCADCEYGNSEWPEDPEHTNQPHWVSVEDELPSEFQSVWAACKMGGRENWTIETIYDPYLSCPWGHIPVLDSGKAIVYAWMDRTEPEPPQEVQDGTE